MRILLCRRLCCLSGVASSVQAATCASQASKATTGPPSVVVAPTPTTCSSIQAASSPRTTTPGTAASLSAVSPSAARHNSVYNTTFSCFLILCVHLSGFLLHRIYFGITGVVYTLYVFCGCAPYVAHFSTGKCLFCAKFDTIRLMLGSFLAHTCK